MRTLICIIISISVCLIACIAVIAMAKKALNDREAQISELQQEIDSNKQVVYVAMQEIKAGEVIEENVNVMKNQIYTSLDTNYYMQEDMIGSIALLNIDAYQPISSNMVSPLKITQDSREYEINVANLMTDQKPDDYVDVRIMFPTGEDYLILAKKPVKNLIKENSIFYTYMDEDEILRMASATIDAFTVTGAYIYTTRYVASSMQEDAIPNYYVKPEVIDLINSDPNVLNIAAETLNLNARLSMEERLRGLSEDQLAAISEGHEIQDTAKGNVLLDVEYTEGYEATPYEDSTQTTDEEFTGDIDSANSDNQSTDNQSVNNDVESNQSQSTSNAAGDALGMTDIVGD